MQLLFINQFFWPDTAATGQFLTDVAREIDPASHAVTLLCGKSVYGAIDSISPPPVKIVQCADLAFSRGKFGRVLSYASFFLGAMVQGIRSPKPAVVLTLTTPPLISLVGTLLKSLRGARHFIWEMDVYPDIAVDLNVLPPRSIVTRLVGFLADLPRKRADAIIALGDDMKARLVARGIPAARIIVAENWADGDEITPAPFPDGPLIVHYSGTFGLAHEERTITLTMKQLRNDDRFRFVFVGGGARRAPLEEFCRREGIQNAEFRPYASRSELSTSLAEGHVGLVTQIPETEGSVVPSKSYGIMAAGRPMLYVGSRTATPARLLARHECGWRIEPGNPDAMVRLLLRLEQDRGLVREAGARARIAFEQYYDRPIGVGRILSILGVVETPLSRPVRAAASPLSSIEVR